MSSNEKNENVRSNNKYVRYTENPPTAGTIEYKLIINGKEIRSNELNDEQANKLLIFISEFNELLNESN